MKTNTVSLTILDKEPEKLAKSACDILLLVRTPEGDLMANRVRSLLREYGNRVQIPSALALEILEDRKSKSRKLKSTERDLGDISEVLGYTVGILTELRNATSELLDCMVATLSDHDMVEMSEGVDAVNYALEAADDFLGEIPDNCDCADCCDDESET